MASIHRAAETGDLPGVKSLLEGDGALVQSVAANGWTPLMEAAYEGHRGVVRLLLDGGADVNYRSPTGYTALHLSCARGHEAIAALLLDRGADTSAGKGLLLMTASEAGHVDIVRLLLRRRAVDVDEVGLDGGSALLEACSYGRTDVAHVLLADGGADWRQPNFEGVTPMVQAHASKHTGCIRLLEEADRAYALHKVRFIQEVMLQQSRFPHAPLPDFMRTLQQRGRRLPWVELREEGGGEEASSMSPKSSASSGGFQGQDVTADDGATSGLACMCSCSKRRGGSEEEEAVVVAEGVLSLAVKTLPGDVFTELLETMGITTGRPL